MRRHWAFWLAAVLAIAAAAVGLRVGIGRLGERWEFAYQHGWLVLGMAGWLLMCELRRVPIAFVGPSIVGVIAVAAAVLLYIVSVVLDVSVGMQVMLPMVLLASIAAIGGLQLARTALIPVAFLYFAIPVWDLFVVPLQKITVGVVSFLLSLTGPVAYIVGNVVHIPAGTFEIATDCSGVRYFMVSLAIATFIGLTWYQRWPPRLLLLAVAAFAAMVTNWVRVYTLILIGEATAMRHYFIAKSHEAYGWFVFAFFLAFVLWLARELDQRETAAAETRKVVPPLPALVSAQWWRVLPAGAMVACIIAAPSLLDHGDAVPIGPSEVRLLPEGLAGWNSTAPSSAWRPKFQEPYFASHEALRSGSVPVDVYLARYLHQRPGSKLVAFNNKVSAGWQLLEEHSRTVRIGDRDRKVIESRIAEADDLRLVWHWYLVGGKAAADSLQARILEIPALLRGRRDGALIAVSAPCGATCDQAAVLLGQFVAVAGPRLEDVGNGLDDGPLHP